MFDGDPVQAERRRRLVERLAERGISDPRVLRAIRTVPRERFVPLQLEPDAYEDIALPIGCEQTISQPYMVGLMTQELRLTGTERVLEIGTGSGYQAAVLSLLCAEVVTIERIADLSWNAQRVLTGLGRTNVEFHVADGTVGWPPRAPYDGIVVTAGSPSVPAALYDQLAAGGRLVIPVGDEEFQDLQVVQKTDSGPLQVSVCGCRFVKLIGAQGWDAA